jgi:hypothetical protein
MWITACSCRSVSLGTSLSCLKFVVMSMSGAEACHVTEQPSQPQLVQRRIISAPQVTRQASHVSCVSVRDVSLLLPLGVAHAQTHGQLSQTATVRSLEGAGPP